MLKMATFSATPVESRLACVARLSRYKLYELCKILPRSYDDYHFQVELSAAHASVETGACPRLWEYCSAEAGRADPPQRSARGGFVQRG